MHTFFFTSHTTVTLSVSVCACVCTCVHTEKYACMYMRLCDSKHGKMNAHIFFISHTTVTLNKGRSYPHSCQTIKLSGFYHHLKT